MNLRQLGLLPILFISGALVVLVSFFYPESVLPKSFVYELPAPFSFSHSLFLSFAAIFMSYFFARGYVRSGSVNLVTLGVGSLILGAGFLTSQILGSPPFGVANELVGISSLAFLSAGILFAILVGTGNIDMFLAVGKVTPFLHSDGVSGQVATALLFLALAIVTARTAMRKVE